jgi:hypothetical protein
MKIVLGDDSFWIAFYWNIFEKILKIFYLMSFWNGLNEGLVFLVLLLQKLAILRRDEYHFV